METATGLLKIMLENGWNLRLKDTNQFLDNNEKNKQEIKKQVDFLCQILSSEYCDNIPIEEVKEQIFDLAVENITKNTLKYRENLYLFDYKGRPICAIPSKYEGWSMCDYLKYKHGIYLSYGNYFESTKKRSLKRWEKLLQIKDNPIKLKRRILFYRLTE